MDFPTILGFLAIIRQCDSVFESETERLVCGRVAPPPVCPALVPGTGTGVCGGWAGPRGQGANAGWSADAPGLGTETIHRQRPCHSPQGRLVPWRAPPPNPRTAILRPGGVLISCKETETKRFAEM